MLRYLPLFLVLFLTACSDGSIVEIPLAQETERTWLGPEFYANRLQDWSLRDGVVQAVEGRASKPMRTAHILSNYLSGAPFTVSARVLGGGVSGSADDWGGFLLGAGSPEIDHRISVLSHHWPAPGGGIMVGIDGAGRLIVRDNSTFAGRTGPRGDYVTDDWPLLGIADSLRGPSNGSVTLEISATPESVLLIRALDPETNQVLAAGRVEGIREEALDGTIALVSHGSPRGEGGFGFDSIRLSGAGIEAAPERAKGPVLGILYTQSRGVLKLTAQFGPLGTRDTPTAHLERRTNGVWEPIAEAAIRADSRTATFRVDDWDGRQAADIRVAYRLRTGPGTDQPTYYEGHVPAEPLDRPLVIAGLNCHHISGGDGSWTPEHFWYPHPELVALTQSREPDLLYFAGDQLYEGGLEGIVRSPTDEAIVDYLNHWYRFLGAFGELTRNLPAVVIPDDHDVYHGNIWGAGGKAAVGPHTPASDNGGYIMPPEFVNVVHATQTGHLPDPVDPTPIEQGITVYHTDMVYGGVSFAILADRMWKSAPRDLLPAARIRNGWSSFVDYDGRASNIPDAELLGPRQEQFLHDWADDWSGNVWMKVVLSQTPFANVATIPAEATNGSVIPGLPNPRPGEYLAGYKKAADHDSGGWPQIPRDRAVESMRRGFAVHIAGDQHLGTVLQYGVDEFRDAGYVFTVPSIANIWPRRWFPPDPGSNRSEGSPPYTGDHLDGFGNRMTVWAVANPVDAGVEPKALYDRTPGLGIIKLDPETRRTVFEAWPRWTDPSDETAPQYSDWPISFDQQEGYGRPRAGYLPEVSLEGSALPVIRVDVEATGEWLYTIRADSSHFRPWVFDTTRTYTVRVTDPDANLSKVLESVSVEEALNRP